MTIVLVFASLVLIRLVALGLIVFVALSVGPRCPACRGETIHVYTQWQRYAPRLERRWCMECGWEGLVRRSRPAAVRQHAPGARRARTS